MLLLKQNKALLILSLILIFGVFLRIYQFGFVPPGVNRDEAALGYNAYSILTTGKDEYGRSLPLSFESFGDWKLPGYIYLSTIPIYFFGLNDISIRIVSMLAGIGTIILTFLIAKEIFKGNFIPLFSAFFVALSPWQIFFSRMGQESNTAVFFVSLAIFLFFKSLKEKKFLIIPAAILLGISYFIYASNHIFNTLLFLSILILYFKEIIKNKYAILAGLIFVSFFILILHATLFGADKTKISGTGIFGDPSIVNNQIESPRIQHESLIGKILHNKPFYFIEAFSYNYLEAFSPEFLFIKGGGNRQHNMENSGNMYLFEYLLFILGIFFLFSKSRRKEIALVILWILIAPIAPSITKDAPHSNRMVAIFPMLSITAGCGAYFLYSLLKKKKIFFPVVFSISIFFILNFVVFFDRYFTHFPLNEAERWGIHYKKLYAALNTSENKEKNVLMPRFDNSPYIYFLFYGEYDPILFQKNAMRYQKTKEGFHHVKSFDRYEFRNINWKKDYRLKNTIVVEWTSDLPDYISGKYKTQKLYLPNGTSVFSLVYLE